MFPDPIHAGAKPQRNCPAVDHAGRAYFAIANKVFAFDNSGGDLTNVWTYETGGRILGSPVVGSDEHIRVHSEDGHLHIIANDGQRVGTPTRVGDPLGWATPLVDAQNTTWICGYHGGLSKVDANGNAASSLYFRGKQRFDCTGLIHDGVLYVGAENACVYAIPLGESRAQNVWNHLNEEGRTGWFINSALALASGPTLVVASRDDRLYGFQLDGRKRWTVDVNGQMLGSPIVDTDDSVYVGLSVSQGREKPRGALIRIDGVSQKIRWRYETESPVESTPVLGNDGTVYFGDNDGFIHAVNGDGKQVWTEQVADGVRSSGTILAGGRVVFGLENGQFVALKCESQSLRAGAWAKLLGNASQTGNVS
jgi:outer membrane protein assembly factor BamB